jgi:hypothetical protein
MQPFLEVTITRPWYWGIAIVSAPGSALLESSADGLVTAAPGALVIKVRHAQDIEGERFEGDWDRATASLHVRSLAGFEDSLEPVAYDGVLDLPEGRLEIGDADGQVTVNDLDPRTRARVCADIETASVATSVRIDLAPEATGLTS